MTVGQYLETWLAHVRARVRAATYEGYESLLRLHVPLWIRGMSLAELRPLDLQRLYSDLLQRSGSSRGLSAGTVLNLHLVITQALSQAVRWELLAANPANGAQPPRPRRTEPFSVDQEMLGRLVHATVGTPLELPASLAAATGMRRGEILALRWSAISPDYSHAHVQASLQATRDGLVFERPKTARSRRAVALPALAKQLLRRHRHTQGEHASSIGRTVTSDDLVVAQADGSAINPDSLSSSWRRLIKKHGFPPIRFHDLRHAHATLMLLQGVHPKIVSERLGHASIGITLDTSSHVLPSMQAQAVEAFDLAFPYAWAWGSSR